MALVSDIQLQNASVTPPKLDTTLKYTVGGLTATTGIAIGETVPISLSGLFTAKSANNVDMHLQTTKVNGDVSVYLNNDSDVNWALKLSGTSNDSFVVETVSGDQTGRITLFSIKPAGHVGFGTIDPSANSIVEFVGKTAASASLRVNNSTDNTTMEWKAEATSGSIGTTSSSDFGLRRGGVTIATLTTDSLHPTVDGTNDLGTTSIRWRHGYFDDVTITNGLPSSSLGIFNMHVGATMKILVAAGTTWTLGWWQSSDGRWWLLGNTADVSTFTRADAEFYIPTASIDDVPIS